MQEHPYSHSHIHHRTLITLCKLDNICTVMVKVNIDNIIPHIYLYFTVLPLLVNYKSMIPHDRYNYIYIYIYINKYRVN